MIPTFRNILFSI